MYSYINHRTGEDFKQTTSQSNQEYKNLGLLLNNSQYLRNTIQRIIDDIGVSVPKNDETFGKLSENLIKRPVLRQCLSTTTSSNTRNNTQSQGTQPQGTQSQGTQPQSTQSQGTQPQGTQSQGTQSQSTQSQGTQSQSTQSQSTQSQGFVIKIVIINDEVYLDKEYSDISGLLGTLDIPECSLKHCNFIRDFVVDTILKKEFKEEPKISYTEYIPPTSGFSMRGVNFEIRTPTKVTFHFDIINCDLEVINDISFINLIREIVPCIQTTKYTPHITDTSNNSNKTNPNTYLDFIMTLRKIQSIELFTDIYTYLKTCIDSIDTEGLELLGLLEIESNKEQSSDTLIFIDNLTSSVYDIDALHPQSDKEPNNILGMALISDMLYHLPNILYKISIKTLKNLNVIERPSTMRSDFEWLYYKAEPNILNQPIIDAAVLLLERNTDRVGKDDRYYRFESSIKHSLHNLPYEWQLDNIYESNQIDDLKGKNIIEIIKNAKRELSNILIGDNVIQNLFNNLATDINLLDIDDDCNNSSQETKITRRLIPDFQYIVDNILMKGEV